MDKSIILGLDIGATNTRVLVTNRQGKYISYHTSRDMRNPENVHRTICMAVEKSGCSLDDVELLGAGIAGFPYKPGAPDDLTEEQGKQLVAVPGLGCETYIKNDAVAAYIAAFRSEPGMVFISGSGCAIYGLTGIERIYDREFGVGAGILSEQVLSKYFGCNLTPYIHDTGLMGQIRGHLRSTIAPIITTVAADGDSEARKICAEVVKTIVEKIMEASEFFISKPVHVALIGSVANDKYIKGQIEKSLNHDDIRIVEYTPPEIGAIVMALEGHGISVGDTIEENLQETIKEILKHK